MLQPPWLSGTKWDARCCGLVKWTSGLDECGLWDDQLSVLSFQTEMSLRLSDLWNVSLLCWVQLNRYFLILFFPACWLAWCGFPFYMCWVPSLSWRIRRKVRIKVFLINNQEYIPAHLGWLPSLPRDESISKGKMVLPLAPQVVP